MEYRRPPMSPSALEERATQLTERHGQRLQGLTHAGEAQQALRAGLTAAMETEEREVGLLDQLLSLFVDKPQTPLVDALTAHHEQAVQQVRALGHHIEALEADRKLLEKDIRALNEELLDLRADTLTAGRVLGQAALKRDALALRRRADDSLELQAQSDELEALHWDRATEHRRFQATGDRLQGLLELNRELREVFRDQHQRLCRLHDAGTGTLTRMRRHLVTLRAAASARDLTDETERALTDLRSSVGRVCVVADESASTLSEHVDELEHRMRRLDRDADSRRDADAEVEAALKRVRRWQ